MPLALCQVVTEDRGLRLKASIEQVAAGCGSQPALRRVVDALVDNAIGTRGAGAGAGPTHGRDK